MTIINIQEFGGYNIDEFKAFLLAQNEENFKIALPKENTLFNTSNNEIAWEFAIAAYVGQKLNEISFEFKI